MSEKMEKGFAEGIDHDMPNRFEFNKLLMRILELERRIEGLEEKLTTAQPIRFRRIEF